MTICEFRILLIFSLLSVTLIQPAGGTPEISDRTGFSCAACHEDPSGGGMLNDLGERYQRQMALEEIDTGRSVAERAVRFVAGYLHLLVAILWVGTILYIHLILKPSYAVKGIPRGELILGWSSILSMAVTGSILSYFRFPTIDAIFSTRFGRLWMLKVGLFLVLVIHASIVTFVIRKKLRSTNGTGAGESSKNHTGLPDGPSTCDGKDGRPAYVVFKGKVYDVSGSPRWKGGTHFKVHDAGRDLTEAITRAPHGEEKILSMPVVGDLRSIKESPGKPTYFRKVFYLMAYANLVLALAIVFIVALWRWG